MESSPGNKASQKSGTARRSRVAEVHNMSERVRKKLGLHNTSSILVFYASIP